MNQDVNEENTQPVINQTFLREASEELSAQRGSRDRVLEPLKKMERSLKTRRTQLANLKSTNQLEINRLVAKNAAIDTEAEQITSDLKQIAF